MGCHSTCRGSSRSRDWTQISSVSRIGRQILYHCATWEGYDYGYINIYLSPSFNSFEYIPRNGIAGLSGECVISLVPSHCSKDLKWGRGWGKQCYSSVTAQFYLASKGKYILEAWWWVTQKKRGAQFGLFFLYGFSPPTEPALCKLG